MSKEIRRETREDRVAAYRTLCSNEPSIPIFAQDWWLDAVLEDNWDVALVEMGGVVQASMPFVTRRRKSFVFMDQPGLTQSLGPWIRCTGGGLSKQRSREKDLMGRLIDQVPPFGHFRQNWHHVQQNWLPFRWRGFQQTTRYTYRLNDLSDLSALWKGCRPNIRGDVRKAKSEHHKVSVRRDCDLSSFLQLNALVFSRQGMAVPYSRKLVQRIDAACAERGCRQILIAEDDKGRAHAGAYIVWDKETAYYLMGGGDPDLRASGATSLCLWDAIEFSASVTKSFDFEGSMIESVERFFGAFGTVQTPYHSISRTDSLILRIVFAAKDLLRRSR